VAVGQIVHDPAMLRKGDSLSDKSKAKLVGNPYGLAVVIPSVLGGCQVHF
jgi:hypothetical protein